MITKAEKEKLIQLVMDSISEYHKTGFYTFKEFGTYLNSLTEQEETNHMSDSEFDDFMNMKNAKNKNESAYPVETYTVNWNRPGYLPESEGYGGLEDITEIKSAIISCLEDIVGDDEIEKELLEHDLTGICNNLRELITMDHLEHEIVLFDSSREFCVYIYKDNTE